MIKNVNGVYLVTACGYGNGFQALLLKLCFNLTLKYIEKRAAIQTSKPVNIKVYLFFSDFRYEGDLLKQKYFKSTCKRTSAQLRKWKQRNVAIVNGHICGRMGLFY